MKTIRACIPFGGEDGDARVERARRRLDIASVRRDVLGGTRIDVHVAAGRAPTARAQSLTRYRAAERRLLPSDEIRRASSDVETLV